MPFTSANGIQFYYELHGSEDAEVLVLNNGVIMNAATSWVFQTPELSKHFHLLQYDCRGQGQSDHPREPYSMDLHADDLNALLEALNLDQAHIAGISYGGEVAQAFALKYPEKTQSLILIDTVSEVGPELEMIIQSWVHALEANDPEGFFYNSVPWNFSPEWIKANGGLLADAKERYKDLDFAAVINLCQAFFEVNFTDRLHQIDVPTCIMVGEKDLVKGLRYAQILKREIPQAEFHILQGSGHVTCWEVPDTFNSTIIQFIKGRK
jgi:3-oxoadipate enol-lactonase